MSDINFEREHTIGETVTARPGRNAGSRLLGGAFLLITASVLGYAWYAAHYGAGAVKTVNEDFNTAKVAAGQFNFKSLPPPKTDNKLALPPVPMPTPTPPQAPLVVAAAPVIDTGEAERKAEEERLRKEAAAREASRIRSSMLVVDAASTASAASGAAATPGAVKVIAPDDDPNSRFLASVSAADVETSHGVKLDRIDALIPQGTVIRGVLETAIQSDLPGMVRATTSEDVYSFDGRRILIPKSTMLTGEYRAGLTTGQTRVFIVWTRMLRADGVSMALGSGGTDTLGRAGLAGEVDNHYFARFGSAVLLSIVGGASSFLAGLNSTGNSVTTAAGATTTAQQAQTQAQQTAGQTANDLANTALKESINIPPTIIIDQGTRIDVLVKRDLDFSDLYLDPVRQALNELRRSLHQGGR